MQTIHKTYVKYLTCSESCDKNQCNTIPRYVNALQTCFDIYFTLKTNIVIDKRAPDSNLQVRTGLDCCCSVGSGGVNATRLRGFTRERDHWKSITKAKGCFRKRRRFELRNIENNTESIFVSYIYIYIRK